MSDQLSEAKQSNLLEAEAALVELLRRTRIGWFGEHVVTQQLAEEALAAVRRAALLP